MKPIDISPMKLKTGKDEIVYLLTQVFKKYEQTTGHELVKNTNRKNYEELARILSQISNELPNTAETLGHDFYSPDRNGQKSEYPYRKYDITGGQIKDAYNGIVTNPRPFMVDSCYIYLYGVGRKAFEQNPLDANLLYDSLKVNSHPEPTAPARDLGGFYKWGMIITLLLLVVIGWVYYRTTKEYKQIKRDLNIVPYQPTAEEIKDLEGVWQVYIGSPQARVSDDNRYHMVVSNIVDVHYKDGYFVFNRYGASFDHYGYMQYENPDVISIHSYVKNASGQVESPRLSLLRMDKRKKQLIAISASWNFDVGSRNDIIGIREVYTKQGTGGEVEEVINTIENSSCRCKIVSWEHGGQTQKFQLRNENVDSLKDANLKQLIDEHSILLREPKHGIILTGDPDSPKH